MCEDESMSFLSLYYCVLYLNLLMSLRPLGVSVFYCERNHFLLPWEVYLHLYATVTICLRMTSVSEVCSCIMR